MAINDLPDKADCFPTAQICGYSAKICGQYELGMAAARYRDS